MFGINVSLEMKILKSQLVLHRHSIILCSLGMVFFIAVLFLLFFYPTIQCVDLWGLKIDIFVNKILIIVLFVCHYVIQWIALQNLRKYYQDV